MNALERAVVDVMRRMAFQKFGTCYGCGAHAWCAGRSSRRVFCVDCTDSRLSGQRRRKEGS